MLSIFSTVDFEAIDLSTSFLGRPLRLPFLASSMTGGPDVSDRINRALLLAEVEDVAIGLGVIQHAVGA